MAEGEASGGGGGGGHGQPDAVLLAPLTEDTFLHNLHVRYKRDLIYSTLPSSDRISGVVLICAGVGGGAVQTYVGNALVSVNPCRALPLYSAEAVRAYLARAPHLLPPHLYALTAAAYRWVRDRQESQCIVITGESGAGKTEAARVCLQCAVVAGGEGAGAGGALTAAGTLLEAFGNAATARNHNASRERALPAPSWARPRPGRSRAQAATWGNLRVLGAGDDNTIITVPRIRRSYVAGHSSPAARPAAVQNGLYKSRSSPVETMTSLFLLQGKLLDVEFDFRGLPVGGHITHYLLEKERACGAAEGERNFHVFYQLLAGADAHLLKRLRLQRSWEQYSILRGAGAGAGAGREAGASPRRAAPAPAAPPAAADDKDHFAFTKAAMARLGLGAAQWGAVERALAFLLKLGNVQFEPQHNIDGSIGVRLHKRYELSEACALVGVDEHALASALGAAPPPPPPPPDDGDLFTGESHSDFWIGVFLILGRPEDRTLTFNVIVMIVSFVSISRFYFEPSREADSSEVESGCSGEGSADCEGAGGDGGGGEWEAWTGAEWAARARDRLLAALYSRLFTWLIHNVNEAIKGPEGGARCSLGILDVYGFESLAHNGLERLLINYAAERVQACVTAATLRREQDEYAREGLDWTPLPYQDHEPLAELLDLGADSVLGALRECSARGPVRRRLPAAAAAPPPRAPARRAARQIPVGTLRGSRSRRARFRRIRLSRNRCRIRCRRARRPAGVRECGVIQDSALRRAGDVQRARHRGAQPRQRVPPLQRRAGRRARAAAGRAVRPRHLRRRRPARPARPRQNRSPIRPSLHPSIKYLSNIHCSIFIQRHLDFLSPFVRWSRRGVGDGDGGVAAAAAGAGVPAARAGGRAGAAAAGGGGGGGRAPPRALPAPRRAAQAAPLRRPAAEAADT
ncbi:unnamed protein product [Diatraea saccharalis]|uniref:Myosin motor domain-containing protein n=1 Tax=Diatraea saccharalis TaxID=40085 RepID=A0A9N9WEH2_9NEOP|nr:unnamed protein product [Diatraea saccharalis]